MLQALKTKMLVTDINNCYLDINTKEEVTIIIYSNLKNIKSPRVLLNIHIIVILFTVTIVFKSNFQLPNRIYRL